MLIKLTNAEIYNYADRLEKNSLGDNTYIPVVYNFYIQKNIETIFNLKAGIDKCRYQIISHYGEKDKSGNISVIEENTSAANQELHKLSMIEQDVEIFKIPIQAFKDIELTTGELKSIMFMIEEDPDFAKHLANPPSSTKTTLI